MTQINENAELSILPKSDEKREQFYKRINEWIGLQYQVDSAQESQKDIMNMIADDFVDSNPDVKKQM